jgi:hypothetical protein
MIHDPGTLEQLQAIEKGTLRAPQDGMDDKADAFAFATVGRFAETETVVYDNSRRVRIGW